MAMLMTYMAIAKMAEMAIMAIMVTSVMANGNFSMALRSIQLKGIKQPILVVLNSYQLDLPFRYYQQFLIFFNFHVIFTMWKSLFFQANFSKNGTFYRQKLLQKVAQWWS